MENIFEKMLLDKYDIGLRPHEFIPEILAKVFGPRNTRTAATYQVGIPVGNTGDKHGDGIPRRSTESEGSSKLGGYFDRLGKDTKNKQLFKDSIQAHTPVSIPAMFSPTSTENLTKTLNLNKKIMRILMDETPEPNRKLPPYQPTGLLIYPSTFIELDPDIVEMHACRGMHILLACKHAMGLYVQELNEKHGGTLLSEGEFDEMFWDYDSYVISKCPTVYGWPYKLPTAASDSV